MQQKTAAYTKPNVPAMTDVKEEEHNTEEGEESVDSIANIDVAQLLHTHYHLHTGHITMDEISCLKYVREDDTYIPIEVPEMLEELTHLWTHLCESKAAFLTWSSQTKMIDVKFDARAAKRIEQAQKEAKEDNMSNIWKNEVLYATYRGYVNLLPVEVQTSTAALFGMVVAIAHVGEEGREEEAALGIAPPGRINLKDIQLPPGVDSNSSLNQTLSTSLFAGLVRSPLDDEYATRQNLLVFEDGDRCAIKSSIAARYAQAGKTQMHSSPSATPGYHRNNDAEEGEINTAVKNACNELSHFENAAIFRAQVPRLLGQGGIPLRATYSKMDRSILESELLTFTSLSPADIHRFNCMQLLEKLVESIMPKRINFTGQRIGEGGLETSITKRKFLRHIPGFTLPQLLAKDLMTEPVVLREYYPLADQLLLALVWIPPDRRLGVREWDPSKNMRVKPTYDEYRVLQEKQVGKFLKLLLRVILFLIELHPQNSRGLAIFHQYDFVRNEKISSNHHRYDPFR